MPRTPSPPISAFTIVMAAFVAIESGALPILRGLFDRRDFSRARR